MYANGAVFKGRVAKWGLTKSKNKGTEQFFVTFTVLAQIQDGDEADCPTSDQTIYRPITDNTIDFIVEDLKHLGFTGTDFTMLEPESPNAHDFAGVEFLAKCSHEEYQGKTNERWSFAWGGGEAPKLEASAVSKLNQRFGAKLKQAMGGKPNVAKASPVKSSSEQLEEIL